MKFHISGHQNLLGTHKTTLEFTKDSHLTKRGDCIIGINADFKLASRIFNSKKIKITIKCDGLSDTVSCDVNPDFKENHEIVIRKTGFLSSRTLGINSDKASIDIDRRIIQKLKNPDAVATVSIEGV